MVERHLAKVNVARSNRVTRFKKNNLIKTSVRVISCFSDVSVATAVRQRPHTLKDYSLSAGGVVVAQNGCKLTAATKSQPAKPMFEAIATLA